MKPSAGQGWTHPVWTPLHVAGLVCLGGSQPVLDLVARHPAFLSSYALAGAEVVIFCLAVAWVPPVASALPLVPFVVKSPERARRFLAAAWLFAAFTFLGAGLVARFSVSTPHWALGAVGFGALALSLYLRFSEFRFVLSIISSVLLFAPVFFLASENVSHRWLGGTEETLAPPVRNPEPVILVLFDELAGWSLMTPDLQIDAERFPNLAGLAEVSDWYPTTFSAATETRLAVPSALTSVYIEEHEERVAQRCSFLSRLTTSYDLHVNEVVTDLAPESAKRLQRIAQTDSIPTDLGWLFLHWFLPDGLRHHLPPVNDRWFDFSVAKATENAEAIWSGDETASDDVTEVTAPRFAALLDSIQPAAERPPFIFHHSLFPHSPLRLLPSGQAYAGMHQMSLRTAYRADPWDALISRSRYELQVRAVDRLVGRLVQRLQDRELFDNSWIILTADHGIGFHVGEFQRPSTYEYLPTTLSIPLLIKRPHQASGRKIERYAEIVDVGASLAAELGYEPPCDIDGRSLFGDDPERSYEDTVFSRVFGYDQGSLDEVLDALRREVSRHRQVLGMDALVPERLPGDGGIDEATLASQAFAAGPHRLGPYGSLVGLEVPENAETSNLVIELLAPSLQVEIEPDGPFVPAWIYGRLHAGPVTHAVDLAFALNGRFVATTRTREILSEEFFSAIADPALFPAGTGRFEVFSIAGPPEAPELRRLHLVDEEGRTRQVLARRGTEILRQGGASGFAALSDTANLKRLKIGSELSFVATTVDPRLYFQAPPFDASEVVVEVDLTVSSSTEVQVWYQTAEGPSFSPERVRRALLGPGRNRVALEIDSGSPLLPFFRIDPGRGFGSYTVHSLSLSKRIQPR